MVGRNPGGYVAAALLALAFAAAAKGAHAQAAAGEAARVVGLSDVQWGPPGNTPRFPQGVRTSQLRVDPVSGGPTYLARFPAGSHFDLHWHTHAEYVVVLGGSGTIVLDGRSFPLALGSYVVIPSRAHHSWDVPAGGEELLILVRREGPADFHFVDP